jgi:hypothetical protein
MKSLSGPVFAVAGAVLLSFCGSNPGNEEQTVLGGDGGCLATDGGCPGTDAGPLPGTINVTGRVMNSLGRTIPNVVVFINSGASFSATTRTDSRGSFSVANVPPPYDATVIADTNGVTVSVGLRSAIPTVVDMFSTGPLSAYTGGSARFSGTVTGGIGFPVPQGYRTSVLFTSPNVQTDQHLVADGITAVFTNDQVDPKGNPLPLAWDGPLTTTGTLHSLQWLQTDIADPNNVRIPSSYSGYGFRENVSLANGSTVTGQNIALSAVTPATFSGAYTPPTGYTGEHKLVALQFKSGGLMLIVNDTDAGEAFSYTTPNIAGATLVTVNTATNGVGYSAVYSVGVPVDATDVATTSAAAAELNVPVDGATGVTAGTSFSWADAPGVKLVFIASSDPDPWDDFTGPSYAFLTSGTSVTIPDLTSAGLGLPSGSAAYQWQVYGVGPYADVETASSGLIGQNSFWYFNTIFLAPPSDGGFTTASATRSFTTIP